MAQRTKILLAEDSPTDAILVRAALEQTDSTEFEVHHVERLSDVLERLVTETFDILLLDLGLPDSQGLETLSKIRMRSNQIPVVVLTGLADEGTGLSALSAGAQDYLVKGQTEGRNLIRSIRYAVERHQLLAREQSAREQAEAASRAKDVFLAVVSHELRTPLTPVMLLTSALRQMPGFAPGIVEDLETIHHHVEIEIQLINNLLDIAGIRAGKLRLQLQRVDVHELIREVVKTCDTETKARNLNVALHLDAGQAQIDADPVKLKQVFWNVFGNATKFSRPMGHIVIRSEDADNGHLRVQFIDDGVGIERDAMPRIIRRVRAGRSND
jgi:signal transduction histidine kinase